MTELATRAQAFGLIAEGVAAGLSAPWRLYLARGCRYLSLTRERPRRVERLAYPPRLPGAQRPGLRRRW